MAHATRLGRNVGEARRRRHVDRASGLATAIGDVSGARFARRSAFRPICVSRRNAMLRRQCADAPLLWRARSPTRTTLSLVRVRQDGATEVIGEIKPPSLIDDEAED